MTWWATIPAGITLAALVWMVAGWQDLTGFGSMWGFGGLANLARVGVAALASLVAWLVYLVLT